MSTLRFLLGLLASLLAWVLLVSPVTAQTPNRQLFHITFSDQADLQQLTNWLDIWEVDHVNRRLLAPLTGEEAATLLQTHALTLALDQSPLSPAKATAAQISGIPGYACYRTVDETFAALDQMAVDYPHLVQQIEIGDSWEKTRAGDLTGDDLRMLILTNKAHTGPKFRFLLMGAIHAREYATTEMALRFAESLLQRYGNDANATWLLDHGELHLLPIANPDGRRLADTGQLWRKNTNTDAACTDISVPSRTYGVDLNRNSSFKWNECDGFTCSSSESCRETYRGEAAVSEPEVAAIEAYIRSIFPDQRGDALTDSAPETTEGLFISLHSYGRLVLFPWGYTTTHAPNAYGLATLARRLGYPLGYTVCQAGGTGCLYQTDGTTDDFAYGDLGVASFTIELGTAFFQSCSYFENTMLQPGLTSLNYAFHSAPNPYKLAEGPQILNLAVYPQVFGAEVSAQTKTATHVTISATVDAGRIALLSGSGVGPITEPVDSIRDVRITVNALPWQGAPLPYPVAAVDGGFDSIIESISSSVEMACLPSGRHTLYLQAQDDQGDWGIVAAEFVTVTNTSPFAISTHAGGSEISKGEPVSYTFTLTNTGATTGTFAIEALTTAGMVATPSQPYTLTAGASLEFIAVITPPQNSTADTTLSTVIIVRSLDDPAQCRQLQAVTNVQPWRYHQRLVIIGKY